MTFRATRIERTGDFLLPIPPDQAFSFFSPEGERAWVPDWDPVYLSPDHPSEAPGTVFRTKHGGEETLWLILGYDRGKGEAEYVRVTPGSRMGTVRVRCRGDGESGSRITVSYALTALSEGGNAVLADLTESRYTGMLQEWRQRLVVIFVA
jgi:hypothetical protein